MPPNPKCMVCSPKPEIVLKIDTGKVTVKELRDDVLIKALNMVNPDVMVDGKGIILISSEEGETDCNNDKMLKDLSIVDGCVLKVDDFFQSYELTITIIHKDVERDDASVFEVIADPSLLKPDSKGANNVPKEKSDDIKDDPEEGGTPAKKAKLTDDDVDDDDDLCVIEDDDVEIVEPNSGASGSSSAADTAAASSSIKSPPKKRKTVVDYEQGPSAKRSRNDEDDDDLICIDDD